MKISIPEQGVRLNQEDGVRLWQTILHHKLPFDEAYLTYKLKWQPEFARSAIAEYRKFAFLALLSSSEVTPSENIDEVWHIHILHTEGYAKFAVDCGNFLHHYPGLPTQKARWSNQYSRTHELYQAVFGEQAPTAFWPFSEKLRLAPKVPISQVLDLYKESLATTTQG